MDSPTHFLFFLEQVLVLSFLHCHCAATGIKNSYLYIYIYISYIYIYIWCKQHMTITSVAYIPDFELIANTPYIASVFCEARRASHCHSPQTTYSSKSTCCAISAHNSAMHVVVYAGRLTSQRSMWKLSTGNEVIGKFNIPADDTNAFGNPEIGAALAGLRDLTRRLTWGAPRAKLNETESSRANISRTT